MFELKFQDESRLTGSERSGLVSPVKSNTYEYGALPSGGSNAGVTTAVQAIRHEAGYKDE